MILLDDRSFTPDDQWAFAHLSGDYNPMHMDEVAARRTVFGGRVVHGVHLVLWALESWLEASPDACYQIKSLKADFVHGVGLADAVDVYASGNPEHGRGSLEIRRGGTVVTRIQVEIGPRTDFDHPQFSLPVEFPCEVRDFAGAAAASGLLPLCLDEKEAAMMFPAAVRILPLRQIAIILATTRLVGMECPGLHSLYSALQLDFSGAVPSITGDEILEYRVEKAEPRFALLLLAVSSSGVRGQVRAFVRPAPVQQLSVKALQDWVEPGEFAGKRALVIGGSRGLGEVVAKLLAAGGADVTISYRMGAVEAEKIVSEIREAGGQAQAILWDVTSPAIHEAMPDFQIMAYFATPHISADKTIVFSPQKFRLFCDYYIAGFVRAVEACQPKDGNVLNICYPSTIFLDEPAPNMAEYTAAKAAGEETCRQLVRRQAGVRIFAPRLPRMLTDQTTGVLQSKTEEPAHVMIRALRRMIAP